MGVTLVVDRYAFSGVAYSAAKRNPRMTYEVRGGSFSDAR